MKPMLIGAVMASSPIVSPNPLHCVGLLQVTGVCPDGSIQLKVVGT